MVYCLSTYKHSVLTPIPQSATTPIPALHLREDSDSTCLPPNALLLFLPKQTGLWPPPPHLALLLLSQPPMTMLNSMHQQHRTQLPWETFLTRFQVKVLLLFLLPQLATSQSFLVDPLLSATSSSWILGLDAWISALLHLRLAPQRQ